MTPEEKKAIDKYNQELLGNAPAILGASALPAALGSFLPVALNKNLIKQKEAERLFPQADPRLFALDYRDRVIPLDQQQALKKVFGASFPKGTETPTAFGTFSKLVPVDYFTNKPQAPSPELGSFQQYLSSQPISTTPTIQALTVTPAPGPSRFSAEPLEKADAFAKLLNERTKTWDVLNEIDDQAKYDKLKATYPPQGGYVWGNINKPQYSYAVRENPSTGEIMASPNPSLYVSQFKASPTQQAEYLFTPDVENIPPKTEAGEYREGPSWGVRGQSSSRGTADADVSFRKDLIESRGELTTGDLQALLKAKNLPYEYQKLSSAGEVTGLSSKQILEKNLTALAQAEGITPFAAVQKYARTVPAVGEALVPPTEAATSTRFNFEQTGPALSKEGGYINKVDLRRAGILPPAEKATYIPSAFATKLNSSTPLSEYSQYGAKKIIDPTEANVLWGEDYADLTREERKALGRNAKFNMEINRDVLRPQAANKLLNRTVENLIEQAKPTKALGLGGIVTGGIATAMDPAVIDALAKGNYSTAGKTAAINTGIGSVVGTGIQAGLNALQAAGYARPAAIVGGALPAAGGALAGLGAAETIKALDRAYQGATGRGWTTRNQVRTNYPTYAGPTPTIQPRMGTAIKGGKSIQVPYGSVAGMKQVGRPWWDVVGSKFQGVLDAVNSGRIIGR